VKYYILIILNDGSRVWLGKDYGRHEIFDYRSVVDLKDAHPLLSFRSAQRHWQLASNMFSSAAAIYITVS